VERRQRIGGGRGRRYVDNLRFFLRSFLLSTCTETDRRTLLLFIRSNFPWCCQLCSRRCCPNEFCVCRPLFFVADAALVPASASRKRKPMKRKAGPSCVASHRERSKVKAGSRTTASTASRRITGTSKLLFASCPSFRAARVDHLPRLFDYPSR